MKNKKNFIFNIIIVIMIIVIVFLLYLIYPLLKKQFSDDFIFNITDNDIEIRIGERIPIHYEIDDDINIMWESNDSNVATVYNGVITGIGFGNTVITGTAVKGNNTITKSCNVSTYEGNKDISLSDIIVPDGELFITKGSQFKIDYDINPKEAYIKSIEYQAVDSNIASFENGVVSARNMGTTSVSIIINKNITKSIVVNVISKNINPTYGSKAQDINVINSISMRPNETKKIEYEIIPTGAFYENIKWESSNENIVLVNDGIITAKSSGEAVVRVTIDDKITKEIKVFVNIVVTGLTLNSSPKIILRVGESATIKTSVIPSNATNKKLIYSSNGGVKIDDNGLVTGISPASGNITITTADGNYTKFVSYIVNPRTGVINSTGGIWGYSSPLDRVPNRADETFFRNLAMKGKGTLSDGIYIYNNGSKTYKYDIARSSLNVDNRNTLMRIYYPSGVDLSEVNTFTFMGGTGERDMRGYFYHLDQNRDEMKSSGIIILVSTRDNYHDYDAINSTEFVKSIVGQKQGMKNTVGVYSMSGQSAREVAVSGVYNRIIIAHSYTYNPDRYKNIDVVIYSPIGDSMLIHTRPTLNEFANVNYGRLIVVTNNSDLYNNVNYNSKFLMINPGEQMGTGHGFALLSKAKIFAYACS